MCSSHLKRIVVVTALSIPITSGASEVDPVRSLRHDDLLEQAKSCINYIVPSNRSDVSLCFPGRLDFSKFKSLKGYAVEYIQDESLYIGRGIAVLYGLRSERLPPLTIRQFVGSGGAVQAQEMLLLNLASDIGATGIQVEKPSQIGDFALVDGGVLDAPEQGQSRMLGFAKGNVAFRIRGASDDLVRSLARELDRVICLNLSSRESVDPAPELKTYLRDLTMASGETLRLPLEFAGSIEAPWKVGVRFLATPYSFQAGLQHTDVLFMRAHGLGKARVGVCVYNSVTLESHWTVFDVDVTGPMNETQRSLFGDRN